MTTNSTPENLIKTDRRLLNPHLFKPGQSGNPKGRPRETLSKHERLVILSEIAKHQIESAVSAGHKIAAIREANLMENVYQEASLLQDNRVINVIVSSEKAKELTENISQRFMKAQPASQKEDGE